MAELYESYIHFPLLLTEFEVTTLNKNPIFRFYKPPIKDEECIILKPILKRQIVEKLNGTPIKLKYEFMYKNQYVWVNYCNRWRKIMFFNDWGYLIKSGLTPISSIEVNNKFGNWVANKLNE